MNFQGEMTIESLPEPEGCLVPIFKLLGLMLLIGVGLGFLLAYLF